MANEQVDNALMEVQQPATVNKQDDVVSIDLAAPNGWTKKYFPKKTGTPRRNEIVFIAPTGDEIKSKSKLERYLKSHPGGPSLSEFDWGTGDTPRRSSRLSSSTPKVTETPESGSSKKRQRKSNPKEEQKKEDTDGEGGSAKGEAPANKTETEKDVKMKEAEVTGNHPEEGTSEKSQIDPNPAKASVDNAEGDSDETKKQEAGSNVASSSDGSGIKLEEKRPEAELRAQAPQKTAPGDREAKPDGKAVNNPSVAGLPEKDNTVEDQPAGNKEELAKELPGVQDQPEAASVNPVQRVGEAPAADAEMSDSAEPGPKDPEKVVSSEKAEPDGDSAKENKEAATHADNKPVDAGNTAHESTSAHPATS